MTHAVLDLLGSINEVAPNGIDRKLRIVLRQTLIRSRCSKVTLCSAVLFEIAPFFCQALDKMEILRYTMYCYLVIHSIKKDKGDSFGQQVYTAIQKGFAGNGSVEFNLYQGNLWL